MTTTLYEIPSEFEAGTTVTYRRQLSDYPASAGWVLKGYLLGAGRAELTGEADGDEHVMTWPAATTATLADGTYSYEERASKDGAVHTVARRYVKINPNIETATATRLELELDLIALRAQKDRRLPAGMKAYAIAGIRVENMDAIDVERLIREKEAALVRLVNPEYVFRTVNVRF